MLESLLPILLAAGASVASAIVGDLAGNLHQVRRALIRKLRGSGEVPDGVDQEVSDPLVERVEHLRAQLAESAQLLPALQSELELRIAALDKLQADALHYEKLAALNQEQAEAVQRLVEQTVGRGLAETEKAGGRAQTRYFFAGLLASIPLGIGVNYVFEWLTN